MISVILEGRDHDTCWYVNGSHIEGSHIEGPHIEDSHIEGSKKTFQLQHRSPIEMKKHWTGM